MFKLHRFIFSMILTVYFMTACSNPGPSVIIETGVISGITVNSAVGGGIIVYGKDEGNAERGLVWDTGHDPSINNHTGKSYIKTGKNEYSLQMKGLEPATKYYVRAYVAHGERVSYGDERSFTTYYDKVTDIDGNIYYTIKAGRQEWISTNLKTNRYRNGDIIPRVKESSNWGLSDRGSLAIYNNDPELQEIYGNLYNFYTVIDERGLCPAGWRVPGDGDWNELEIFLGMDPKTSLNSGLRDQYVGGMLKESGTEHWMAPNAIAMDLIGFSDIPGGYRHPRGQFYSLGRNSNSWTSSSHDENNAWYRNIYFNTAGVYRGIYDKSSGFSVRCIKNNE